jgi:hypothetical protein
LVRRAGAGGGVFFAVLRVRAAAGLLPRFALLVSLFLLLVVLAPR